MRRKENLILICIIQENKNLAYSKQLDGSIASRVEIIVPTPLESNYLYPLVNIRITLEKFSLTLDTQSGYNVNTASI